MEPKWKVIFDFFFCQSGMWNGEWNGIEWNGTLFCRPLRGLGGGGRWYNIVLSRPSDYSLEKRGVNVI